MQAEADLASMDNMVESCRENHRPIFANDNAAGASIEALHILHILEAKRDSIFNKPLYVSILQRLLRDDRKLLRALCVAPGPDVYEPTKPLVALSFQTDPEDDIRSLIQNLIRPLLLSDKFMLQNFPNGQYMRDCHDKRRGSNSDWFLPSCEAILGILQEFSGDDEGKKEEGNDKNCSAIAVSKTFHTGTATADSENVVLISEETYDRTVAGAHYNPERSASYFEHLWNEHLQLCVVLMQQVVSTRVPPTKLLVHCVRLWHQLVVCLSHPDTAAAVLNGADKALTFHEKSDKAGFSDYFRPLLPLFKLEATNDPLVRCVYQTAALLVAYSGRFETRMRSMPSLQEKLATPLETRMRMSYSKEFASPKGEFVLHSSYLQHMILTQFTSSSQHTLWNEVMLPWARSIAQRNSSC